MKLLVLFPHQLFEAAIPIAEDIDVVLHEHPLYFTQFHFHPVKLRFHRESMGKFAEVLTKTARSVRVSCEPLAEVFGLYSQITVFDPVDDYLERDIRDAAREKDIEFLRSPMFLCSNGLIQEYKPNAKRLLMADFYTMQRRRLNVLVDANGGPVGGQWSFDAENRKPIPNSVRTPRRSHEYPTTHREASEQLDWFLQNCLNRFGAYEDAMRTEETWLFHSVLTPALNSGLLTPGQVVDRTLAFCKNNEVPIESQEGFLRQIIGWREFIRLCYIRIGAKQRSRNFFNFANKLPEEFWTGTTGLLPADRVIRRVNETGYCHHIERLMVMGCLFLLLEIDPDEVYRWFMTQFIDAYDWVMVPNVYGMSQYADGGLMTTKPYLCGSSYLRKMGDWKTGPWTAEWDGLYWSFVDRHREVMLKNQRASFAVRMFDNMPEAKRREHWVNAEAVFSRLDLKLAHTQS